MTKPHLTMFQWKPARIPRVNLSDLKNPTMLMILPNAISHLLRYEIILSSWKMAQRVSFSKLKQWTFSSSLNKNKTLLSIHFSTFSTLSNFQFRYWFCSLKSTSSDISIVSRISQQDRKILLKDQSELIYIEFHKPRQCGLDYEKRILCGHTSWWSG